MALKDFTSIKDNAMSVFIVDSESDRIRAAVAIASKIPQDKAFGYAIFDVAATDALGINRVATAGETPDAVVNEWHHDLKELSLGTIAEVAKLIKQGRVEEIPLPTFKRKVLEGVAVGQLDRRQVHRSNLQ